MDAKSAIRPVDPFGTARKICRRRRGRLEALRYGRRGRLRYEAGAAANQISGMGGECVHSTFSRAPATNGNSMQPNSKQQQILVWWVLWGAFLIGVCVIYVVLGKGAGKGSDASFPWVLAVAPLLASVVIRWGVLPKLRTADAVLPAMIAGMALAEATTVLGLFLFPSVRLQLFIVSFFGIFQFIPIYAGRYFRDEPPDGM